MRPATPARPPALLAIPRAEGSLAPQAHAFRTGAALFGMVAALPMHVNGAYRASKVSMIAPRKKSE